MDRGARWLVHVMALAAMALACVAMAWLLDTEPAHVAAWVALSRGIGNTLRGMERDAD